MSSALRLMVRVLSVAVLLACASGYPTSLHRRARRDAPVPQKAERQAPRGGPGQLEESLHQLLQQASMNSGKPVKPSAKIGNLRLKPVSNAPPSPSFQNLDLNYLLPKQNAPPKYAVPAPKINQASPADIEDYLSLLSKYQVGGNAATAPNLLAANYPTTAGQADLLPNAYPQNSYTADDYIEELEDAVSYIMNKLYQYQAIKQLNNEYADYYQLLREVPAPQARAFDYGDYADLFDPSSLYGDDAAYEQDSAAFRENGQGSDDQASAETGAGDSEESETAAGSGDETSTGETAKTENTCPEGSERKDCAKKDSDKPDLVSRLKKPRN